MTNRRVVYGLLGAIIGAAIVLTIEVVLLAALNARPRGLGWLAFPILGILLGWQLGVGFSPKTIYERLLAQPARTRLLWAGSAFWILCVLSFFAIFNPYGRFWSDDDWLQFLEIIFAPPALLFIGARLFRWGAEKKIEAPAQQTSMTPGQIADELTKLAEQARQSERL